MLIYYEITLVVKLAKLVKLL